MSDNEWVQIQVSCAVCGAVRGPSNHWWAIYAGRQTFEGFRITIFQFDINLNWDDFRPACGEECLLKLVSRSLQSL